MWFGLNGSGALKATVEGVGLSITACHVARTERTRSAQRDGPSNLQTSRPGASAKLEYPELHMRRKYVSFLPKGTEVKSHQKSRNAHRSRLRHPPR